jgi:hypothetical protein
MNQQLEQQLLDDFPSLFESRIPPFCIAVGDGWEPIVRNLCEKLTMWSYVNDAPLKFRRVKEKFGELRISLEGGDEETDALLQRAEYKSYITCEACGKPGHLREDNWMKTRCDACQAAYQAAKSVTLP